MPGIVVCKQSKSHGPMSEQWLLGHGDHKGVEFQIAGGRRKNSSKTLAMERVDFEHFPGDSEVSWESAFEGTGVLFKSNP